ncbi:hypothetical protein [Tolumonas lignilytica]|uniref:hypothetical protein n=1 Tax=Tolumonas lignilytica TaxID=1283284 RepID=UPI0004BBF776|nr:hypothetical protein [Tolumonas lignilytica]
MSKFSDAYKLKVQRQTLLDSIDAEVGCKSTNEMLVELLKSVREAKNNLTEVSESSH